MKITVLANDDAWNELVSGGSGINWVRAENVESLLNDRDAASLFNLCNDAADMDYSATAKPVFINSVCRTLQRMNAGGNVRRINGWSGFTRRSSWEIAGKHDQETDIILEQLQKKAIWVPDEPGFISARVIAMIINEAYFAKAENVSTETEIDTAMKLGTNYPFGPFEWAAIIGVDKIHALLNVLSESDTRYKPSTLLIQEASQQA